MNILVLTGAGISAESGIPCYRTGDDKVWNTDEHYNTAEALKTNPEKCIESFNKRKQKYIEGNFNPNDAHYALAEFEEYWHKNKKGTFTIVTQNVDDLHEKAGSQNVYHIHGCLNQKRNLETNQVSFWGDENLDYKIERPNIVLFGEPIMSNSRAVHALYSCDVYLCIGTSLQVWPAAGFIDVVNDRNKDSYFLNIRQESGDNKFKHVVYGKATECVREVLKLINK